jgi:hypothetical protein
VEFKRNNLEANAKKTGPVPAFYIVNQFIVQRHHLFQNLVYIIIYLKSSKVEYRYQNNSLFFHARGSLYVQFPSAHELKALFYSWAASLFSSRQSAHAPVVSLNEKKITEYTEYTEKKEKQRPLTNMESQETCRAIKFNTLVRTKNKPGMSPVFPVHKIAFNINSSPGRAGKIRQEDEEVAHNKGELSSRNVHAVFFIF